jgi:hypothetical protein
MKMSLDETNASYSLSTGKPEMLSRKWSDDDILKLRECYKKSSKRRLLSLFPGRTWKAIQIKAERLGVLKIDGKAIHVHNNGYVLVRAPGYPVDWRGKWKDGRIYEHNLVWYLCHPDDPILPNESIHHVNGDKEDNRIENLQKLNDVEHGYFTKTGSMPIKIDDKMELPPEIDAIDDVNGRSLLEDACREEIERELALENKKR